MKRQNYPHFFATNHINHTSNNFLFTMHDLRFQQWSYHCPLDNTLLPVCYAWYTLNIYSIARLVLLYETLMPREHVNPTLFFDILYNEADYYLEHLALPLQHALERIQDPILIRAFLLVFGFAPPLRHPPAHYHTH
jgi:hypothetical protein